MNTERLVSMVSQISFFLESQPVREAAVAGVLDRRGRFRDSRTRRAVVTHIEAGGEGLRELVRAAIVRLAAEIPEPMSQVCRIDSNFVIEIRLCNSTTSTEKFEHHLNARDNSANNSKLRRSIHGNDPRKRRRRSRRTIQSACWPRNAPSRAGLQPLAGSTGGAGIHLCIGMAYGFSVFWLPLSRAIGISKSVACPADMSLVAGIIHDDLRLEDQLAGLDVHAVLRLPRRRGGDLGRLARARRPAQGGLRRGDRAGAAASCYRRIGVYMHQLWLMWLGAGRASAASALGSATSRRCRR